MFKNSEDMHAAIHGKDNPKGTFIDEEFNYYK